MAQEDKHSSFQKKFIRELLLLGLTLLVLTLNILGIIPDASQIWTTGGVIALGLLPIIESTWNSIKNRRINVDLLATIALSFSLYAREWNSALFINLMLGFARLFGLYTERRVTQSLESLAKLKPSQAHVLKGDAMVTLSLAQVLPGDIVIVGLGEQIPVDGIVVQGTATVNQSSLTGESLPVLKSEGSDVFSATIVVSGSLHIRATKVGAQTMFEKMVALVESSQSAKTRMKTVAERFASWYIGIMLIVSVSLLIITGDKSLVLAVVLVVCADEIAIAIPLAYIAAMGAAARRGIIVKSADFLERAGYVTTLIVDKTGTLTIGELAVDRVESYGTMPLRDVLEISGIVCQQSTHPVARAISAYAEEHGIACTNPELFEEREGLGMRGVAKGHEVLIGRSQYLKDLGIEPSPEATAHEERERARGNTVSLVAYDKKIVGIFSLADRIRPGIKDAITDLKRMGISQTVMLTGDNERVAARVAADSGIDTFAANLLPGEKVARIEAFLDKRQVVAMVGDGVNDAAALSRADVGIAMGGIGSDAAIESADIVLMQDDFGKLAELRDLSQKTLRAARINFLLWGVMNIVGLYFVFTHVFTPSHAALYNFLTDFIPITNSLRLFNYKK